MYAGPEVFIYYSTPASRARARHSYGENARARSAATEQTENETRGFLGYMRKFVYEFSMIEKKS